MTNLDDRLRDAAAALEPSEAPIPPFKGVQRRARRRRMIGVTGALVVIAAVTFAGVSTTQGRDRVIVQNPGPTSTTVAPTTTTTTAPTAPVELSDVTIYLIANGHVVAAGREVAGAATPEAAVRALLAGPAGSIEGALGFSSAIPSGSDVHSVTVDGSVATVDLTRQFEIGPSNLSMEARVAQVVFTVTQFSGIDHVRFRIDGAVVTTIGSTIGGESVMVDNVDRAAFANITPLILVESPTPGQTVGAPLRVRGMSDTFEAGINYTLYDSSGGVLAEGYTTATAGTGAWGTFDFDITPTVEPAGPVRLSVYELSAKDGSRVNETSIPLELQP
jgi:spore germination protein GerM